MHFQLVRLCAPDRPLGLNRAAGKQRLGFGGDFLRVAGECIHGPANRGIQASRQGAKRKVEWTTAFGVGDDVGGGAD